MISAFGSSRAIRLKTTKCPSVRRTDFSLGGMAWKSCELSATPRLFGSDPVHETVLNVPEYRDLVGVSQSMDFRR